MAVAFDAVGPSSAGTSGAGVTSLSWTHTNAGSGVAVIAGCGIATDAATTTCTIGGTSATSIGKVHTNNSTSGYAQAFGLANVATGGQTVALSISSASDVEAGSQSYTGAGTTNATAFGTAQTAFGNDAAPTITVTGTTSGNMVAAEAACGNGLTISNGTSRWINNQNTLSGAGNAAGADKAAGGSVTIAWTTTADFWGIVATEVLAAAAAGGVVPAAPGQTWLRQFHHRQTPPPQFVAGPTVGPVPLPVLPGRTWLRQFQHPQLALSGPPPAAAAAGPQIFQVQPPRNARATGRARLGRVGACAAGILAVTTLSPQPSAVPPARPQPVIQHLAPHRAFADGILRPPPLPFLTAKLPPTAISPRPQHRAFAKGILAKTTLSPQPTSVPGPQWRQPFAPRPAHRAIWRAVAGPAPAVVAATPAAPSRPQPVTNRPPPPHRASGKGILATTTLSPQPTRVPPPQWRQPFAPRPSHRAIWRGIAGPAPAVVAVTAVPPSRPAPVTNRPPAPHRAITRRVLAPPAPLVPPARPQPVINRPPPPHRAIVRGVLAKTTLSPQPTSVPGPQWRQPFAPRPAHRAIWRRIAGAAPPPPPFTIGVLTATDVPRNVLTAAGAGSVLTASTAPQSTITAGDQRTGGPN